jgi:hypothetical protein
MLLANNQIKSRSFSIDTTIFSLFWLSNFLKAANFILVLCFKKNRICISMELVTSVLGDHGQRPKDDYGMLFLFLVKRVICCSLFLVMAVSMF